MECLAAHQPLPQSGRLLPICQLEVRAPSEAEPGAAVTVLFDNRNKAFEEAAAEKKAKYEELRKKIANDHPGEVAVFPFIVGSLGSWDPANDVLVRQLCSRSYAKLMRKLCVSEVIGYSRDVFTEHIGGIRARHG